MSLWGPFSDKPSESVFNCLSPCNNRQLFDLILFLMWLLFVWPKRYHLLSSISFAPPPTCHNNKPFFCIILLNMIVSHAFSETENTYSDIFTRVEYQRRLCMLFINKHTGEKEMFKHSLTHTPYSIICRRLLVASSSTLMAQFIGHYSLTDPKVYIINFIA